LFLISTRQLLEELFQIIFTFVFWSKILRYPFLETIGETLISSASGTSSIVLNVCCGVDRCEAGLRRSLPAGEDTDPLAPLPVKWERLLRRPTGKLSRIRDRGRWGEVALDKKNKKMIISLNLLNVLYPGNIDLRN